MWNWSKMPPAGWSWSCSFVHPSFDLLIHHVFFLVKQLREKQLIPNTSEDIKSFYPLPKRVAIQWNSWRSCIWIAVGNLMLWTFSKFEMQEFGETHTRAQLKHIWIHVGCIMRWPDKVAKAVHLTWIQMISPQKATQHVNTSNFKRTTIMIATPVAAGLKKCNSFLDNFSKSDDFRCTKWVDFSVFPMTFSAKTNLLTPASQTCRAFVSSFLESNNINLNLLSKNTYAVVEDGNRIETIRWKWNFFAKRVETNLIDSYSMLVFPALTKTPLGCPNTRPAIYFLTFFAEFSQSLRYIFSAFFRRFFHFSSCCFS